MNRKCKELIPEKRIMTYLSPLVKCVCVCGGGGNANLFHRQSKESVHPHASASRENL